MEREHAAGGRAPQAPANQLPLEENIGDDAVAAARVSGGRGDWVRKKSEAHTGGRGDWAILEP